MVMRFVLDLETRSELDVKDVGPHKYAAHPSTEIMCVGYKIDKFKSKIWMPLEDPTMPSDLEEAFNAHEEKEATLVAHNAEFEMELWNVSAFRQGITYYPIVRDFVSCTAARAAYRGYPRKLEYLAQALKLSLEKDKVGHRTMLKLSKPRSQWVKDPTQEKWHDNEIDWLILGNYCQRDIDVEALVDSILPELPQHEREIWDLTCRINKRGLLTEKQLIENVLDLVHYYQEQGAEELKGLTDGRVQTINQNRVFLDWLKAEGCEINNLQAQTIIDALKVKQPPKAKRGLELRQLLGKSSIKKFESFKTRCDEEGVVRDLLVYGGAVPTLRWTGSGIQPQNFPRGKVKDTETVLDLIRVNDPELIDLIYPSPLEAFSAALRNMIIPHKGYDFECADFAQIETRALFWVCDELAGLRAFKNGDDLYKEMAADVFHKAIIEITPDERFVGKESVLGCGYGMGDKKFVSQCAAKNVTISKELGKRAVTAYRQKYTRVVAFWKRVEQAFLLAVSKNVRVKVNDKIFIQKKPGEHWATIILPSGRPMYYPYVEIKNKETSWGEIKATISYWGVDSKTKKWQREYTYGGKITENICQGISRDLMAEGMLNCEKTGYLSALTVHDELLSNRKKNQAKELNNEKFVQELTKLPKWAEGFPIKAEGWSGPRYKK
jgi:DNA polymerase